MATQLSELFFQTLSDPQKRQQYDDFGYTAADAGARQQRGQGHGFHGFQPFESFFGGGRGFEFKFNFDDFGGGFGGGESLIDKYRINLRFVCFPYILYTPRTKPKKKNKNQTLMYINIVWARPLYEKISHKLFQALVRTYQGCHGQGKRLENEMFSRSGKSQGI